MGKVRKERLLGKKLGFIGAGNMGGALIRGLLTSKLVSKEALIFYDPSPARQKEMQTLGLNPASNNRQVLEAQVIILAVKPQLLSKVLTEIKDSVHPGHLLISIAAGVPLATLEQALPQARLIRAMPNTPLMVLAGMTAISPGSHASREDLALARELFGAAGRAEVVEENHLDAVTALCASGAGFVAVFIEALADGGVKMGLPRTLALEMATQTVLGAARLCLEEGLHPATLKDMVASPGGTTMAGLHALEQGGFRGLVINAIESATWRAQDLATHSGKLEK